MISSKLKFAFLFIFPITANAEIDNYTEILDKVKILENKGQLTECISELVPFAISGKPEAQNLLGYYFELSDNSIEALKWYKKAAESHCANAQFNLGRIYDFRYGNPLSVKQDDNIAKLYYQSAIYNAQGETQPRGWASINLAIIYDEENDMDSLHKILEKAVNEKIELRFCPYHLASNYYKNEDSKAFYLYRISAENGYPSAQYKLGRYFEDGILVDKDTKEAIKWYQRASDNGNWSAQERLGASYERLWRKTLDDRDLKKALKWYYKVFTCDNVSGMPRIIDLENTSQDINGVFISISPLERLYNENVLNAQKYESYQKWETGFVKPLSTDSYVDVDVPAGNISPDSYALIIANEDYDDVPYVPYALNDGEVFYKYCNLTFGIPDSNIHFIRNATLNQIKKGMTWLTDMSQSKTPKSILIYYSGHGLPAEDLSTSYLLPKDGFPKDLSTGYNIAELFKSVDTIDCDKFIFLDACFSGTAKNEQMLIEARGVAIKSPEVKPSNKTIVFSACSGTETAYPFNNQKHGLFTYFLLKSIKDSNGIIDFGKLSDEVTSAVKTTSMEINNKLQTPSITVSDNISSNWRNLKF